MDILVCGAPLDSSFQKDKLELVNKGSLSKRRKPTRANLKNLLSPSNNTQYKATSSLDPPAASCERPKINGHVQKSERTTHHNLRPPQKFESSLPRTSPQPNHVADAHQFSIEAKLKRKKSDLGRSAVLIQTWERRTWSNSLKQRETKDRNSASNRFQNKENIRNPTMPEPRACVRSQQKGESFKKGGLVLSVRDSSSDDAMLYRVPDSGRRSIKQLNMNGCKPLTGSQEPEWISLSKKLCAKFVEGYIEPNSADSYLHEEPDGVMQQPPQQQQVSKPRTHHQTTSQPQTILQQRVERPKKVAEMTPSQTPTPQDVQPPWIDLSRKLCNKFIEEHIEYPVIPCDESVKKALCVEPNGDVRIIEKVGKPSGRKSKARKDSEPEWISLSRKLRAKFIESHIDDPDTISMDNQLNASDPELSSESMSDTYQEIVTPPKTNITSNNTYYKEFPQRTAEKFDVHQNCFQNPPRSTFPEKECCWEYQEMEFDQESNSGTYHEAEYSEDSINSKSDSCKTKNPSNSRVTIDKHRTRVEDCETFTSFAETAKSQNYRNAECYNNDVHFAPHETAIEKPPSYKSVPEKVITVQFVSPRKKENKDFNKSPKNGNSPERDSGHSAFFNLTTWDEAHCKSDGKFKSELRSKSMNNICDSDENCSMHQGKCKGKANTNNVYHLDNHLSVKDKIIYKSEDVLDKLECKISTRSGESIPKLQKNAGSCELRENNEHKTHIQCFSSSCQNLEVCGNLVSVNGRPSRSSSSESFESFEIGPEPCDKRTENDTESACEQSSNETPKVKQIEKSEKGPDTDPSLISNDRKLTRNHKDFVTDSFLNSESDGRIPKGMCSTDFDSLETNNSLNYSVPHSRGNRSESSEIMENSSEVNCCEYPIISENLNKYDTPSNYPTNERTIKGSHVFETKKGGDLNFSTNTENYRNNEVLERGTYSSRDSYCTNGKTTEIYENRRSSNSSSQSSHIESGKNNPSIKEKQPEEYQLSNENKMRSNSTNDQKPTGMKKHYKCNGVLPNSKEIKSSSKTNQVMKEKKITNSSENSKPTKEAKIRNPPSERMYINEYANISSSIADRKTHNDEPETKMGKKYQSVHSVYNEISDNEDRNFQEAKSRRNISGEYCDGPNGNLKNNGNGYSENFDSPPSSLKIKSQSMYDIHKCSDHAGFKRNESHLNGCSNGVVRTKNTSAMTFQEFASESDIPLCAKLVAKQNGKLPARSVSSSSNRNASPCSETSHVYEDMFKETPSCPSDSETSSWTVMKNNSYYINGRSSSMNDLDLSDSCSMSVKCDYASSGSGHSTLQSRHSSVTSSSFYVNLRDYDSHMLEPSLNRKKKDSRKASNGKLPKLTNSNPPTPESLRHLFTSPFHNVKSPANRISRSVNHLPQESESHYYSTAAATSSAFKHGFDPTPPKQKKTERSSSVKIKDIAHGIILTFRRFQNHSKSSNVSPNHYVDVSHLAESNHTESGKSKSKKEMKEQSRKQLEEKKRWRFSSENRTDSDSGCHLTPSDVHNSKARRSSSDLTGNRPKKENLNSDILSQNGTSDKKKTKTGKKASNAREKGKKTRSKSIEPRPISTVSRKVQQMPDGTLYLVTTVSGDTALPGVYSDSPDSSSELSSHRPVKLTGESNC